MNNSKSKQLIPLAMVSAGYVAKIVTVNAGKGAIQRLMELGLTPGVEVKVLKNDIGPLLLQVRGITVALGKGIAMKVLVEIV